MDGSWVLCGEDLLGDCFEKRDGLSEAGTETVETDLNCGQTYFFSAVGLDCEDICEESPGTTWTITRGGTTYLECDCDAEDPGDCEAIKDFTVVCD